jgi:flagellar hook protein FlgE
MSLFGAMTSGVSGLAAQSSAMASIADNISNVNTVGYKATHTDFRSLVTKQASETQYAAGGVQARPRTGADIQGLLQSSSSITNLAISGDGFFVVNQTNRPGMNDQFLFTRAGAFYEDHRGYLRNTGGHYLQGWPTDADGTVILPQGSTAAVTNQNTISPDFLETINLNRLSGAAAPTTNIVIGANLPARDAIDTSHSIDVQFYDTLGNFNAVNFQFTKLATNAWDLTVAPPTEAAVVTLFDEGGNVFRSVGQLEFAGMPDEGQSITVSKGGTDYPFNFVAEGAAVNANDIEVGGTLSLSQVIRALRDAINAEPELAGVASTKTASATDLIITGDDGNLSIDPNGVLTADGTAAIRQSLPFTVEAREVAADTPAVIFDIDGTPLSFNVASMAVAGFESGAANMDGVTDSNADNKSDAERITLNLGDQHKASGLTQFSGDFSPSVIEQNGARFGVLNGVSVSGDGLVSALFNNGEHRAIYRIPLATFVNANGLDARSGNAWSASEDSGVPTLRQADSGLAGEIAQSSLEASTVDIGEEFSNMIVVQRAYSAATRILSTADEMLEELQRIKR